MIALRNLRSAHMIQLVDDRTAQPGIAKGRRPNWSSEAEYAVWFIHRPAAICVYMSIPRRIIDLTGPRTSYTKSRGRRRQSVRQEWL